MVKISNEEIISFMKENGYTYIDENKDKIYSNDYYWYRQDSTGYVCRMSYSNLKLYNKSPIIFGFGNTRRIENMKLFISNKNPNIKIINSKDIYKNKRKRTLFTMECECGNVFTQTFDDIYKNTRICCQKCTNKLRGKTRRESKDVFDLIHKLGYKIIEKVDKPSKKQKILVENKDGYRGYVCYKDLKKGSDMTIFSNQINKDNFIYNANIYAKNNNIKSIAIDFNYDNNYSVQALDFKCSCGNIFTTSINSFTNGKTRCDNCSGSISRYEDTVRRYLNSINIKYIPEFVINSCRDILPLPFDFCLKESGKLIEVDGVQHFEPTTFCSKVLNAEENLEYVKKHDEIKNNYCKQWNIPLLRISYKEILDGSYKEKIMRFIEE